MKSRRNRRGGSQIAEFAPALLILFFVILFPMVDIIYLAIGYCGGWYLNHMSSRAAATVAGDITVRQTACNNMTASWLKSTIAAFVNASVPQNIPTPGTYAGTGDPYIEVDTQVQVMPLINLSSVPFLNSVGVDGVTKPITFQYIDKRPVEETDLK